MKIKVQNIAGQAVREIDLPDEIYGLPMNEHVLHSVVKSYRANRRQGNASVKTRSFVSGTGKKPFRQKGTGNARQGTSRSPNMPGGAVAHGPNPRSYDQKINQKTKELALKVVLSDKVKHGKLIVVDDFALSKFSTSQVAKTLTGLNVGSALLSDERKDQYLYLSARNIKTSTAKLPAEINAEDLLRYESFVVSETGLNALHQRLGVK